MVEETTKKAIDEMMVLYKQNKIEELKKIRDDVNETSDRKIAAHTVLQLGKDPRRLF